MESVENNVDDRSHARSTRSGELMELVTRIEGEIERRTSTDYRGSAGETGAIESTVFAEKQFIKFFLAGISLAVPLTSALEIGRLPAVIPLPNLPGWILGISNVRGEIVSIVDPKGFFGWPQQKKIRDPHFIILHTQEIKVGFLVDKIAGIVSLRDNDPEMEAAPATRTELEIQLEPYISDVSLSDEKPMYVLDVEALLSDPRMKRDSVNV